MLIELSQRKWIKLSTINSIEEFEKGVLVLYEGCENQTRINMSDKEREVFFANWCDYAISVNEKKVSTFSEIQKSKPRKPTQENISSSKNPKTTPEPSLVPAAQS